MRRIYVRLRENEIERLAQLAQFNHRHPADEAALLLIEAIKLAEDKLLEENNRWKAGVYGW